MRLLASVGLLALAGCSDAISNDPDAVWQFDTFSSSSAGENYLSYALGVRKYTFREDGTGVRTSISSCGESVFEVEFVWEDRDGDAIAIVPGPGEDSVFDPNTDEWRLTPQSTCQIDGLDRISVQEVSDGNVSNEWRLLRGDVCLAPYEDPDCPEDFECDDCETVWCNAAPEPCDR